jgi:hypothetical protein
MPILSTLFTAAKSATIVGHIHDLVTTSNALSGTMILWLYLFSALARQLEEIYTGMRKGQSHQPCMHDFER